MRRKIQNNIKAYIKKISISERVILISSIFWFFSCFLWWFSMSKIESYDNKIMLNFNAFNWIWAVLWYFYFLCTISIIAIIILKIKNPIIKDFTNKQSWIYLFINWEALFIWICAFLIYSAYWLSNAYSEIWFWLYLAIITQISWLIASHFYFLKKHDVKNKKFKTQITKY